MARVGIPFPFSPWTQRSLGPVGMAAARKLTLAGDEVRAYAAEAHGPFTVWVIRGDVVVVGVGTTAGEALARALAKLPEAVA